MVVYECTCCAFVTSLRKNYEAHLKTKKHLARIQISPKVVQISPDSNTFPCEYCGQRFKHKSSIYKHIKYTCAKSKDEDIKELVRLMNLQLEQKDKELDMHKKQLETQSKQLEIQSRQIDKLANKLEIHTTNIQINYNLLPYQNTDISHLTDDDFIQCVNQSNCAKLLIQKIHFNPTKPENMNVYISNLKDNYMMIYNGTWETVHKKVLNDIVKEKHNMINDWAEVEKFPEMKKKFQRYLESNEKDKLTEEIKLMMYNQNDTRRITT